MIRSLWKFQNFNSRDGSTKTKRRQKSAEKKNEEIKVKDAIKLKIRKNSYPLHRKEVFH